MLREMSSWCLQDLGSSSNRTKVCTPLFLHDLLELGYSIPSLRIHPLEGSVFDFIRPGLNSPARL